MINLKRIVMAVMVVYTASSVEAGRRYYPNYYPQQNYYYPQQNCCPQIVETIKPKPKPAVAPVAPVAPAAPAEQPEPAPILEPAVELPTPIPVISTPKKTKEEIRAAREKRWAEATPEEREKIQAKQEAWKNKTPEEKAAYKKEQAEKAAARANRTPEQVKADAARAARTPEEKQAARERAEARKQRWAEATPEQREKIKAREEAWKNKTPEEKQAARERAEAKKATKVIKSSKDMKKPSEFK